MNAHTPAFARYETFAPRGHVHPACVVVRYVDDLEAQCVEVFTAADHGPGFYAKATRCARQWGGIATTIQQEVQP